MTTRLPRDCNNPTHNIFPDSAFAGNTECGGSNQVAVALVKITFCRNKVGGKTGVVWRVVILRLRVQCMILLGWIRDKAD